MESDDLGECLAKLLLRPIEFAVKRLSVYLPLPCDIADWSAVTEAKFEKLDSSAHFRPDLPGSLSEHCKRFTKERSRPGAIEDLRQRRLVPFYVLEIDP